MKYGKGGFHMEKQTIGAFIAALRKAKGLTQKELAELLNVSDKAVSRWECDQTVPDLTLIPLIADIFEITADELLRGARSKNEQPMSKQQEEKQEKNTQKRLQRLLASKFQAYQTKSVISVALVLIGLITAAVCSSLAYTYLGIGLSLVLFVCAVVLQIILLSGFKNSIQADELDSEVLTGTKRKNFDFSFRIFTALCSLEALVAFLDFRLFVWCGPAIAVAVLLLGLFIRSILLLKIESLGFSQARVHNAKLYIRVFVCFVCIVAVLVASMLFLNIYSRELFEKPKEFTVTDSTKEIEDYIEEIFENSGFYDDESIGVTVKIENDDLVILPIDAEFVLHRYRVTKDEKDGKECFNIKLWTDDTASEAGAILDKVNIVYTVLYCLCTAVCLIVYCKKRQGLRAE